MAGGNDGRGGKAGGSILGSLRDALAAAGRDEPSPPERVPSTREMKDVTNALPQPAAQAPAAAQAEAAPHMAHAADEPPASDDDASNNPAPPPLHKSAAEAARDARGGLPNVPVVDFKVEDEMPTTDVVRDPIIAAAATPSDETRTQIVRGKQRVERGDFAQDPVVGWLVVVGGPGLGAYRPVFEGNNTLGRSTANRVPIDFGDETISNDEQAYIRYDSADRSFLFVPNMAKTNVVSVNESRPAQPVRLQAMDLITVGRTQLVFVPFCGPEFDWSELSGLSR